ncbi:RHS repeat-associated core domain-containing protein [Tahibacter harae]|uniref:DUF6531 domain-containing protein n=1 Tax=Tahibacter harae TaxID=2963937 RepID=A0ABT1QLF3_9GAMM|nr:RHS repeat-associated core domain-containing protein [Tahibacter harae]MCQ4163349.1 DUF6531 domain-containing protein [Tahibacter harae]
MRFPPDPRHPPSPHINAASPATAITIAEAQRPASSCSVAAALASLAFLFMAASATAQINSQCKAQGGDAECVDPLQGEPACIAAGYVYTSDPPCQIDYTTVTGTCKTEGEAQQAFLNNWKAAVNPTCRQPRMEVCSPPQQSLTFKLGVAQYWSTGFDGYMSSNPPDGSCPENLVASCASGRGIASSCRRWVECPPGYAEVHPVNGPCKKIEGKICPAGNPIDCGDGQKLQMEVDIAANSSSSLKFARYYSSTGFYTAPGSNQPPNPFGRTWRHSYQRSIVVETSGPPHNISLAHAVRPDGKYTHFKLVNGQWKGREDTWEILEEVTSQNQRTGWRYTNEKDEIEHYDAAGHLLSIVTRAGLATTIDYNGNWQPVRVTDAFGRSLVISYTAAAYVNGQLEPRHVDVADPAGEIHTYEFNDRERLVRVIRPDSKVRQYLYNEAALTQYPTNGWDLLTGIIDENGSRYASYRYDAFGRAVEEWHGSNQADKLSLEYYGHFNDATSFTTLTDALGAITRRRYVAVDGRLRDAGTTRCSATSCTATNLEKTTRTYDSNGNLSQSTDFRGTITDYDHNTRGQELVRREGYIPAAMGCPPPSTYSSSAYGSSCVGGTCWSTSPFAGSTSAAPLGWNGWQYSCLAAVSPSSYVRATETDWHGIVRAPVERRLRNASGALEAKTQWAYNSRGQVTARCEIAPEDAAAMGYTCSDSIAPSIDAKVRRWTYTYCEAVDVAASNSTCPIVGLEKTMNGPRLTSDPGMNGLDDIATKAYYPTTDESGCGSPEGPCHSKGDLHTVTNALGHVRENVTYDKAGRLLRSRDPNGTLIDLAYNWRGWATSRRVRALASGANNIDDGTMTITYDDVGLITRLAHADGAYLSYAYDDAYRLTEIMDNLGNRTRYTLDASGKRTKEETFNSTYDAAIPGQGLKRRIARHYNVLGRPVKTLNSASIPLQDSSTYDTTAYQDGFDPNGNAVRFDDGAGSRFQRDYDALNRLVRTIHDVAGTNPQTANATVEIGYDGADRIRSVKDPDNLVTTFLVDGLGNRSGVNSPDTGHTSYEYDLAGNRISETDSRGILVQKTYDPLNRLRSISYPDSSSNVSQVYEESNSATGCPISFPISRLTRLTDASGSTIFCYDRRGNVIRKVQNTDGAVFTIEYAYDNDNRINRIVYPSGSIVHYTRDTTGRVVGINWQASAQSPSVAIVTSATYYPFGPLNVLTFGNGRTLAKVYDTDYAIDSIASSASDGLVLDLQTDVVGNIVSASGTTGATTPDRHYAYDRLFRLTQVTNANGTLLEGYDYTRGGDRTRKRIGSATQNYSYVAGKHRISAIDNVNQVHDNVGNIVDRSDGTTLTYGDNNRLIKASAGNSQVDYSYTGRGERVHKSGSFASSTDVDVYVFNEQAKVLTNYRDRTGNGGAQNFIDYIYLDDLPVAQIRDGAPSFIETDHLGTPRVTASASTNSKEWEWSFLGSSFGEHAPALSPNGKPLDLRYPGQWQDEDLRLAYNVFRDFDAATGRYVESDPIGIAGGWNTYQYAGASPLRLSDPHGLNPIITGALACGGGCVAGIVGSHAICVGLGMWNGGSWRECDKRCRPDPCKAAKVCVTGCVATVVVAGTAGSAGVAFVGLGGFVAEELLITYIEELFPFDPCKALGWPSGWSDDQPPATPWDLLPGNQGKILM